MSSLSSRLVRSPNLVAYWKDGAFVLEEFVRRRPITAAPYTILLLAAFDEPRTIGEVVRDFPQYEPHSVEKGVRSLARLGFLVATDRKRRPRNLLSVWKDSFPAIYYQSTCRDGLYATTPAQKLKYVQEVRAESPPPPPHKNYRGRVEVPLPRNGSGPATAVMEVLRGRRTTRDFGKKSIPFSDFAAVIRGTWGQTGWIDAGPLGRLITKTSPSAGARHPIECYVIAWRVEGLRAGLYHYSVRKDRLERLRLGDFRKEAVAFASGQRWIGGAAFLCVMTAVTDRVFWKYRTADAYRLFFLDAGHLAQTFSLLATERRMGPFSTAAMQESLIEPFCGLDGIAEFPVYLCGAGVPIRHPSRPVRASDPIPSSPRPRVEDPAPLRPSY